MAKWIYERWSLEWGKPTGSSYSIPQSRSVRLAYLSDPSQGRTMNLFSVPAGSVFFMSSYYKKIGSSPIIGQSVQCRRYEDETKLRMKGTLLQGDIIAEDGTYPDDGIHTNGYWYVKIKKAFPTMRILCDGQWVEVETGYVLKDGVWKPIEEIYKLQNGQWVQA